MKKVAVTGFFLLLIGATVGGILFFSRNQDNAKNLAKIEGRLNEVKKAFEERGRLLDGLNEIPPFAFCQQLLELVLSLFALVVEISTFFTHCAAVYHPEQTPPRQYIFRPSRP